MAYQITFTNRFKKHFKDLTAQEKKLLQNKLRWRNCWRSAMFGWIRREYPAGSLACGLLSVIRYRSALGGFISTISIKAHSNDV